VLVTGRTEHSSTTSEPCCRPWARLRSATARSTSCLRRCPCAARTASTPLSSKETRAWRTSCGPLSGLTCGRPGTHAYCLAARTSGVYRHPMWPRSCRS
jgi:hypothetical protein